MQTEKLMKELPEIAKVVSNFSETVQPKVFDVIISTMIEEDIKKQTGVSIKMETPTPTIGFNSAEEFSQVATVTDSGSFHLSVRDLKGLSAIDSAKRLIYVTIKAYSKLMNTDKVSRKEVINPILQQWRFTDGNVRNFLANDKGLIREEDMLGLDLPAQAEADRYIAEILNPKVSGSWKIVSKPKRTDVSEEKEVVE